MKNAIFEWMLLPLALILIFQGLLFYKDSLTRKALDVAMYEGAKEAAVEGRFTNEINNKVKNMLVYQLNFKAADININGSQTLTPRKSYITATIEVPRGRIYVIPGIIDNGPSHTSLKRTVRIMSEYIPKN